MNTLPFSDNTAPEIMRRPAGLGLLFLAISGFQSIMHRGDAGQFGNVAIIYFHIFVALIPMILFIADVIMYKNVKENKAPVTIGAIITILLFIGQIFLLHKHYSFKNEIDMGHEQLSASMSRDLPKHVDEITDLVALRYESHRLTYKYKISVLENNLADEFKKEMESRIKNEILSKENSRKIFKLGFVYQYDYCDNMDHAVCSITLDRNSAIAYEKEMGLTGR